MDFAERLRDAIEKKELTIYALACLLDPQNPERAERNLYRWLSGQTVPSAASRLALTKALGLRPDFFRAPGAGVERVAMRLRLILDDLEREMVV
jgi:transcriptional regulator with XRE-family HTH domain